jgi:hypothetical protein
MRLFINLRDILLKTFIATTFIALGCKDEERPSFTSQIDPALNKFVESFLSEAANRGLLLTADNLILKFDETLDEPVCGQCNSIETKKIQKIVQVNPSQLCAVYEDELEALIFHELGHCLLGRIHESSFLPSGDPKSLMIANDVSVYAPCRYPINGDDCDKRERRSYYVDELFNPSTPIPDWGN